MLILHRCYKNFRRNGKLGESEHPMSEDLCRTILTVPPSSEPTRIEVVLVEARKGNQASLGFDAPREVIIERAELIAREDATKKFLNGEVLP